MRPVLYAAAALALLCAPSALAKKADVTPPAAPVAGPVLTGEPLADSLPAYAAFQADISLVNGGSIREAKDIERALDKAAMINRDALTRGLIAYGALAAARNQAFVEGVRKTAAFYGHAKTVNGLMLAPKYAQSIDGGAQATAVIVHLAQADAARILSAGESVKQRAREVQNVAWGKAEAGASAPRTKRLKALASGFASSPLAPELAARLRVTPGSGDPTLDPTGFGGDAFWRSISTPPLDATATASLGAKPATVSDATLVSLPTPTMSWTDRSGGADIRSKMVTLAALYALNATAERPADTERMLNDNITNGCLQGAQLQFYQCVASAKFNYENMACVGEAGLVTVGACVRDVAR